MHKKTYNRPELTFVKFQLRDVLSGSVEDFSYEIGSDPITPVTSDYFDDDIIED